MADDPGELVTLRSGEYSLTLTAHPHHGHGRDGRWYDVNFAADAHHFSGAVRDLLTESDLKAWRDSAADLIHQMGRGASGGEVVLGGTELPMFGLRIQHQESIAAGWRVEIELSPSTEDPHPYLRFRLDDVEPFLPALVAALDRLMKTEAL